jgi:integrase
VANRTVQLYKYIKLPDLGWRYCKAVFYPNNRLKPHAVMTQDGEQTIKDGYYCLSYNRKWEPAGNDPADAQRLLMKKRGELLTVANGGTVVQAAEGEHKVAGSLQSAFEAWIQDFIDGGAHADTIAAKRLVAKEFQVSCKVKTLAAVTRQMCLQYINAWLQKQGNDNRTRFNKFLHIRQFLKFKGINSFLTTKDAPPYDVKDPVALEDEDLALFWSVCPGHKKVLYMVLLQCGLRLQEIQTLRWVDIIGGNEPHIKIQPRPEWNFKPKKHHCRDIPIADPELWAQLMRRKMLLSRVSALVFHTKSGKPLTHLWEDTQTIFEKTLVDMVKAHPHCFRATFCTTLLRQNLPMPDIMKVMGHKDVQSTMRYMAVLQKKDLHAKMAKVKFAVA